MGQGSLVLGHKLHIDQPGRANGRHCGGRFRQEDSRETGHPPFGNFFVNHISTIQAHLRSGSRVIADPDHERTTMYLGRFSDRQTGQGIDVGGMGNGRWRWPIRRRGRRGCG